MIPKPTGSIIAWPVVPSNLQRWGDFLYVDKMDTWSNSAYNTSWLAIAAKIRLYSYHFGYYRKPTSNIYILWKIIPKNDFHGISGITTSAGSREWRGEQVERSSAGRHWHWRYVLPNFYIYIIDILSDATIQREAFNYNFRVRQG